MVVLNTILVLFINGYSVWSSIVKTIVLEPFSHDPYVTRIITDTPHLYIVESWNGLRMARVAGSQDLKSPSTAR